MNFENYLELVLPNQTELSSGIFTSWEEQNYAPLDSWKSPETEVDFDLLEPTLIALLAELMELEVGKNLFNGIMPVNIGSGFSARLTSLDPIQNGTECRLTLECNGRFPDGYTLANTMLKLGKKLPLKRWCKICYNSTTFAHVLAMELQKDVTIEAIRHNGVKMSSINFSVEMKIIY